MADIVLASGSPRRAELLTMAGYEFEVMKTDTDENVEASGPAELVKVLSQRKAEDAAKLTDKVVIAADTVVALDGKILGKPADASDACRMLSELSGKVHSVFTGITLRRGDVAVTEAHETKVYMRDINDGEIDRYCYRYCFTVSNKGMPGFFKNNLSFLGNNRLYRAHFVGELRASKNKCKLSNVEIIKLKRP